MKSFISPVLILFILFTFTSCKERLVKDMMQFDQAFIPAFYYVYKNDVDKAQIAMLQLNRQWQTFNTKYTDKVVFSESWQESIRLIDQWLEGSNCALKDGHLEEALFQLDHARYEMADIRWRANIPYYLDYVWDLEGAIDVAVQTATDPMIDLMDWRDFVEISGEVQDAYIQLSLQTIDKQLLHSSTINPPLFKKRQLELKEKIDAFITAVDCADGCLFAEAAQQLEPAYLNFLMLFGDFESIQTYYAYQK